VSAPWFPDDARLVAPAPRYRRSFLEALREGFRRGTQPVAAAARIREIERDFKGYLRQITEQGGTITVPGGEKVRKVPFSIRWLVEGEEFLGEASIRHELNDWLRREGGHIGYGIRPSRQRRGYGRLILALALEEYRRLGIERVLVTCGDENVASARIIEANGGELENVIARPAGGGRLRRYWITLEPCSAHQSAAESPSK
jgi:predicted acetyltransferase